MKKIFLLLILVLLCQNADSQIADYTVFNSDNGFVDDDISGLYVDSHNKVWIGTNNNGIYTYEDGSFTHYDEDEYDLLTGRAKAFSEDSEGNIWIGFYDSSQGGVMKFTGTEFIPKYTTVDSLSIGRVLDLYVDTLNNDELLVYEAPNVYNKATLNIINEDSIQSYTFGSETSNIVNKGDMVKTKEGDIYITYRGGGHKLYSLEGDTILLKYFYSSNDYTELYVDTSDYVWFGRHNDGLEVINKDLSFYDTMYCINAGFGETNTINPVFPGYFINDIAGNNEGQIWFLTGSPYTGIGGAPDIIYASTFYEGHLIGFEVDNDAYNASFAILTVDQSNNVWVGRKNKLIRLSNIDLNSYNIPDLNPASFSEIPSSNDSLTICKIDQLLGHSHSEVMESSAYLDSQGRYWMGTERDGIFMYQNDSLTHYPYYGNGFFNYNKIIGPISKISEDTQGNIWVAMNIAYNGREVAGLFQLEDNSFQLKHLNTGKPDENASKITAMYIDDEQQNYYIAAGESSSIYVQIYKEDTILTLTPDDESFPYFNVINEIKKLNTEDSLLYVVGSNSSYAVLMDEWGNTESLGFPAMELGTNSIINVIQSQENELWCSAKSVLACYTQDEEWISYPLEGNVRYVFEDSFGRIWALSNSYLMKYNSFSLTWGNYMNLNGIDIEDSPIFEDENHNLLLSYKAGFLKVKTPAIDTSTNVYTLKNNQLNYYPNPADKSLIIEIEGQQESQYQILNANGQLIQSGELHLSKNILNTSDMPNGLYWLQINNKENTISRKLIIYHE